MARELKYRFDLLAPGEQGVYEGAAFREVGRKLAGYEKRSGRKFSIACAPGCPVIVTRLPDPEPSAA